MLSEEFKKSNISTFYSYWSRESKAAKFGQTIEIIFADKFDSQEADKNLSSTFEMNCVS